VAAAEVDAEGEGVGRARRAAATPGSGKSKPTRYEHSRQGEREDVADERER
jgi:hypothetical protein